MLGWILAAWVAFGGKNGEKLSEPWDTCYFVLKSQSTALNAVDWVEYYKKHGYQINGNLCGPYSVGGRIGGCVFSNPSLQWAVPNNCLNGPPAGPYGQYLQYPNP